MIDKDFQLFILQQAAPYYPGHARPIWEILIKEAKGKTFNERRNYVFAHLKALEAFGYLEKVNFTLGVNGQAICNLDFCITEQGLLEVGIDILHPNPYAELCDALLEQAQALRDLSEGQKTTLKKVLAQLPHVALERLRDKGLGALFDLIF